MQYTEMPQVSFDRSLDKCRQVITLTVDDYKFTSHSGILDHSLLARKPLVILKTVLLDIPGIPVNQI